MGFSLLSAALTFTDGVDRKVKWLFIVNGIVGIVFLAGNAAGLFAVNILASFVWGVLFPIATLLLAKKFSNLLIASHT